METFFHVTGHRWIPLTKASFHVFMFFMCPWTNDWANSRHAGDWRRHGAHCDVTVMKKYLWRKRIHSIPSPKYRPLKCGQQVLKHQFYDFFLSGLCRSDIHTGEDKTRYRLNRQYPCFLIADSSNKLINAVFEVQSKSHIYWWLENIGAILQATFQIFLNENVWNFFVEACSLVPNWQGTTSQHWVR